MIDQKIVDIVYKKNTQQRAKPICMQNHVFYIQNNIDSGDKLKACQKIKYNIPDFQARIFNLFP